MHTISESRPLSVVELRKVLSELVSLSFELRLAGPDCFLNNESSRNRFAVAASIRLLSHELSEETGPQLPRLPPPCRPLP
jgi:hypothetical protein